MKPISHKPNQVRLFLFLLAVVCVLATIKWSPPAIHLAIFIGIGVICGFFCIFESWFFPVFRVIMIGSGYMGNAMFLVITALVFCVILTPLALIMRAFGARFMHTRIDHTQATYFEDIHYDHDPRKQF